MYQLQIKDEEGDWISLGEANLSITVVRAELAEALTCLHPDSVRIACIDSMGGRS